MRRIGRTVRIDRIVGIAVIGNHHHFVSVPLGRLDHLARTFVDRLHGLGNRIVNARMPHHIAIGEIESDKIETSRRKSSHQGILHLVSTHLRLQVVGSHLGRRNQDTGVLHIILIEEDVQPTELGVVGRHRTVIQRQGMHSLGRHILLGENDRKFLGAVVPEIEENDHIVALYRTDRFVLFVHGDDGLDELVAHAVVVRFENARHQVGGLLAHSVHKLIVSDPHTLPTLVAVHRVVTPDHRSDPDVRTVNMALQRSDKTLSAVRIGIPTVHEAVDIGFRDPVGLRHIA